MLKRTVGTCAASPLETRRPDEGLRVGWRLLPQPGAACFMQEVHPAYAAMTLSGPRSR
jgi:hypothetical protein